MDTRSWKQREGLTLAKFTSKIVGGKQFSGYEIAVAVDPRDARDGMYKLETKGDEKPTNKFTYTRPLVDGAHWRNKELYEQQQECEATKRGHKIAVTAHDKLSLEKKTETFTLLFPANMKLTDRHFIPTGGSPDEKEIEQKLIMGKIDTGMKKKDKQTLNLVPVTNLSFLLTWRLTDMNSEQEVEGSGAKKPKAATLMDDMMQGTP